MTNLEIAAILREIAAYLELSGESAFRSQAFAAAARGLEESPVEIAPRIRAGHPTGLPGIGPAIGAVIGEAVQTGASSLLAELRGRFPEGILELLRVPGLGPRKLRVLWESLGVSSLDALEAAGREGRLETLKGFGRRTQENLLSGIERLREYGRYRLYAAARLIAAELVERLSLSGLYQSVDLAGALRRGATVVRQADLLLVARAGVGAGEALALPASLADRSAAAGPASPPGTAVTDPGGETSGAAGPGGALDFQYLGLPVRCALATPETRAVALQQRTGSPQHNAGLADRAAGLGLTLAPEGLYREARLLPALEEEEVYRALDLPWIPPELREGAGEIEAAAAGTLPRLLEPGDIRGLLHVHTRESDGSLSLEELARECIRRGLEWLGLSDHSRSAFYAGGLSEDRLLRQVEEARRLNERLAPFRIFCGIESDILADGSLDYDPEILSRLDFVIGSVHSGLRMTPEAATERLVRAAGNPWLTILGHPSGRLLLAREGYAYDTGRLLETLARSGAVLEHNCNPHRLDPDWPVLREAAARGIPIALCPDAHDAAGLDDLQYGITMARKAWLGPRQVLNCLTAGEAAAFFQARRARGQIANPRLNVP